MPLKRVDKIWMNGKFVNWDNAKIHILSHVIHYGTCWFEGIRSYETKKGAAVFRLDAHLKRLVESARIYRVEIPYSLEQLTSAALETIRINKLKSCYIRPLVYRGYGEMGLNPLGCPVETAIAVWEWGKYLGQESIEQGIDVCVSSWNRAAPNTFPTMAKVGANYMNSQLIKLEALANGYAEGIALDTFGYISEGSGENIFIVKSGIIYTTPLISAILQGITRDTVMILAGELGYEVREMQIPREMLYIADEIFFTGTATEIVPIRTVDRLTVGSGKRGDITHSLQRAFYSVVENGIDTHNWLTFVYLESS